MIYLGASFLYCHRNQSSDHRDLSTEHTEDTDRRKLSTELFWKLLRKKSLEEIFYEMLLRKKCYGSTEHTEDTDFLSTEDTFFLVATLEILEEIFNKNMAYGQK